MLLRTTLSALALALTGTALPSPILLPNDARDLLQRKPKSSPHPQPIIPSLPLPLPPPSAIPISGPLPIPIRLLDPTGTTPGPQDLRRRMDDTAIIVGRQDVTITPTTSSFPTTQATISDTNEQIFGGSGEDTENDLIDGTKGCTKFTVIFARGTTESGNVGTSTGPPFFADLKKEVGAENVAVQGVDYPADVPGFLAGGSPEGSTTMAGLIQQAISKCPESKVIISGYSQGAQVVHNAAKILPASVVSNVAGAVLFGDPDNGQPVQGLDQAKTLVICHDGDLICDGTAIVTPAHLTYDDNAGEAANFVASRETFALYDRVPLRL